MTTEISKSSFLGVMRRETARTSNNYPAITVVLGDQQYLVLKLRILYWIPLNRG